MFVPDSFFSMLEEGTTDVEEAVEGEETPADGKDAAPAADDKKEGEEKKAPEEKK